MLALRLYNLYCSPPPKKVFLHKKIHFHKNRKKQNISRTQKELYEKKNDNFSIKTNIGPNGPW